MSNKVRLTVFALGTFVSVATGNPPTSDELARQVEKLDSKLEAQQATLETQQKQIAEQAAEIEHLRKHAPVDWLTQERAEEIKGLIADVLADADTRASLLQSGATAGHDGKNFFIGSTDGNFLLKIGGQVQPRYIANFRDQSDDPFASSIDEEEFGFQIRRVKLFFDGHIFSPDLTYRVQLAANRDTGAVELEEGIIGYATNDQLRLFVGRFSDPLLRDSFTSNSRQLAVERSITSYIFAGNDNYTEGAGVDYRPGDALRFRATVNDGIASGNPGGINTGFLNTPNDFFTDSTDFAATGRADLLVAGNWKQMDDFSAWSGEPFAAFIGAAIHYEVAETGDGNTSGFTPVTGPYDDFITWTIDGSIETNGLNLFAAFIGQHINATSFNLFPGDMDNYGFVVQGGYMVVPDKFEPFARYEWVSIDSAPDDLSLITGGFNYYFHGHATKFTMDVVWSMEPLTAVNTLGAGLSGAGLLGDNPGADDQVSVRAQFQLLF